MTRSTREAIIFFVVFFVSFLSGWYAREKSDRPIVKVAAPVTATTTQASVVQVVSEKPKDPPEVLSDFDHHLESRLVAQVGGFTFDLTQYTMIDGKKRHWNRMACVVSGEGMTVNGRWDASQPWIEAHDADHQFPSFVRVPVEKKK